MAATLNPLTEHVCGTVVELAALAMVHEPSVVPAVPTWLVMLEVTVVSENVRPAIGMNEETLYDAVHAEGARTSALELKVLPPVLVTGLQMKFPVANT